MFKHKAKQGRRKTGKEWGRQLSVNNQYGAHGHGSVPPLAPGGRRSAARRGWSSDQNEEAGRHLRRKAWSWSTKQARARAEPREMRRGDRNGPRIPDQTVRMPVTAQRVVLAPYLFPNTCLGDSVCARQIWCCSCAKTGFDI